MAKIQSSAFFTDLSNMKYTIVGYLAAEMKGKPEMSNAEISERIKVLMKDGIDMTIERKDHIEMLVDKAILSLMFPHSK